MAFRRLLSIIIFFFPICAVAQKKPADTPPGYPQDYFRNPLDIPIFLAGNFGECRPGHFHSGMDIKTEGKENQPVYAAADGYVSRIKMEKGGFGHGLYITHPNGYTTLYAHLNNFAPAIQKYVRAKQYEKQRWDVDLQLSPSQFPVKKGEQIAWSGNTGSSTAPHLHFEIRNTKTEHPLNPELFGFSVTDNLPPVPKEIALYCGHIYSDIGTTVAILPLRKAGTAYKPSGIVKEAGKMMKDTVELESGGMTGVGINVDDFMNGSDNSLTFYTAKLCMDDNIQAQVTLDDIGYDETRYINAYADYRTKELHHKWLQCLFQLPGNHLDGIFSHLNANKGKIDLSDNKTHKIDIIIADDRNNESTISFYIRAGNTSSCVTAPLRFRAGKPNSFNDPNIAFTLDELQLYDDIDFVFYKKPGTGIYSDRYSLHYPYVPLHHYFELKIKPNKPVPFALRSKLILMYTDGKDEEGKAVKADDDGWYKASVRNFGTYWLTTDTLPPVIKPLQKNGANLAKAGQITFEVKDGETSVKTFSGYIDDEWVCFEQHGNSFFYKFDEHCGKGKHILVFKTEDENGNTSAAKLTFTR